MTKLKMVKPNRFKKEAFETEFQAVPPVVAESALDDFKSTVETWEKKPEFTVHVTKYTFTISTVDEIYGMVNDGTPPHVIRPRKPGGVLAFKAAYKPKTIPNFIGSKPGGGSGETVFVKEVNHPGTVARNFVETIRKKTKPIFAELLQEAMSKGAKNSGHAYGA